MVLENVMFWEVFCSFVHKGEGMSCRDPAKGRGVHWPELARGGDGRGRGYPDQVTLPLSAASSGPEW